MKKEKLLTTIQNKNVYAYAINYRDYYYIEKTEEALLNFFNEIKLNKNNSYCEYPIKNQPVNFKIDIDSFNDLVPIRNKILEDIQKGLNNLGHSFDLQTDVFIYESADKFQENKWKHSSHVIIRGSNWCFNSRSDILKFIQINKIEDLDLSVYGDTLFRMGYSSKTNENRYALPINHLDLSEFELFKYGLMSFIEEKQKQNIIKLTSNDPIKKINMTIKSNPIHKNKKLDDLESELINKAFNINIIKKFNGYNRTFFYYNHKCILCDKIHDREDGQYLFINSNIYNLIEIIFKCWNNEDKTKQKIKYWINRNNIGKINSNIETFKPDIIDILEIVKLYNFHNIKDIKMDIEKLITKGNFININMEFIKTEILMQNKDTLYLSSKEGQGKSYAMVLFIYLICLLDKYDFKDANSFVNYIPELKEYENILKELLHYKGKKIIICAANIATLSAIKSLLNQRKVHFSWYKNESAIDLANGKFKVLLITINSLPKLLNQKGLINNPNQYVLWNDETSATSQYISSDTLKNTRYLSYHTLLQLIKFSYKKFFTCADLNDDIIKIFNDEINKEYSIYVNECLNKNISSRIYNIIDSVKQIQNIIKKFLYLNKFIVIVCDSLKQSKLYYNFVCNILNSIKLENDSTKLYENIIITSNSFIEILKLKGDKVNEIYHFEESFVNDSVMLINSERNNDTETLTNLNKIIVDKNIKVLISSPSLGIGTSIDIIHFDVLIALFTGKSITFNLAQQLLNRPRYLKDIEHYIHFINVNKKAKICDYEILDKIYTDVIQTRNDTIKQLNLYLEVSLNNCNTITYEPSNWMTKLYIHSELIKNQSTNDFKYQLIKEILRRGAQVNIVTDINLDNVIINKKIKKKLDIDIKIIDKNRLDDIFNVSLVTREYAKELNNKGKTFILTQLEKYQLIKFHYYNIYFIDTNADVKEVLNYIIKETKFFKLDCNLDMWYKFCINKLQIINTQEINIKDGELIRKNELLMKYLKEMGFNEGILSKNIIEKIDNFIIPEKEIIELRHLFRENGDIGKFRGKNKPQIHINYISRLLYFFYGIEIYNDSILSRANGKVYRINVNFKLKLDKIIYEYLVIKYSKISNYLDINGKFVFSNIHNIYGYYSDYLNEQKDEYLFNN